MDTFTVCRDLQIGLTWARIKGIRYYVYNACRLCVWHFRYANRDIPDTMYARSAPRNKDIWFANFIKNPEKLYVKSMIQLKYSA